MTVSLLNGENKNTNTIIMCWNHSTVAWSQTSATK